MRSALAVAAAGWFVAACGSPEDPFTSGPAGATVTGVVTAAGGATIAQTTIRIACAHQGKTVVARTDSAGRYVINLGTDPDPFEGSSASLRCHFSEPAAGDVRAQLDTSLGFVRGPVLRALQFVDLHER